ncbi:MAG: hypothetical protein AAB013_04465, partial [Planctomycetota bacterium]
IPLMLNEQGVAEKVLSFLNLEPREQDLHEWKGFVNNLNNPSKTVNIAIVGKYTGLKDSYVSIIESLNHAAGNLNTKVNIKFVESTDVEGDKLSVEDVLKNVHGILIPGGFGKRGVEGKINCVKYARENNIPFLGLCLGFQCAVIEFSRNVVGLKNANSTEFAPDSENPVIDIMATQRGISDKGRTMRLGKYEAMLKNNSLVSSLYKSDVAFERHRHRYAFSHHSFCNTLFSHSHAFFCFGKAVQRFPFVNNGALCVMFIEFFFRLSH